jgi:lactate dehydrogenase-like 2-hydroxyacid dehydrogenase
MKTILVTEKEFDKASEQFLADSTWNIVAVPSEEVALSESVRKYAANCVIVGVNKYTGLLYETLNEISLKEKDSVKNFVKDSVPYHSLIARFGVGHDGIDKTLARQWKIAVTNTPGVLSRSVAEYSFWLMGTLLRNIVKGDNAIRGRTFPLLNGTELYGKILLIIGTGEIGRQVARIARFGFGMRVFAAGRCPLDELAGRLNISVQKFLDENGIERYSPDVDKLLPEADIVSLHLTPTAQTLHFMSKPRFDLMKHSAILINTSRGQIVNETDLFETLSAGRIAGAALDVFETEPYQPVNDSADLRTLNNIILTPHLGSSTAEANRRMAESALRNAKLFFENRFDEMNLVPY